MIAAALVLALAVVPARADDVAAARELDRDGRRAEAIALLAGAVARDPGDHDARVVLGSMLSWEGRYDEARAVLLPAVGAGRGDAARALVNVELWSGHPERAERLAAARAEIEPAAADLRVQRARALVALHRLEDARAEAGAAVALAPGDAGAARLRDVVVADLRVWEVGSSLSVDAFDDGRSPWWEGSLDLGRRTALGPASVHVRHAHRFDRDDDLVELEAYPHLREGTYAYAGAGFAAHGGAVVLYPHARLAAEAYQALGEGFEASLGWRGLFFSSATHIATGTIGKYLGPWFAFARGYWVIPANGSTSGSLHLNLRRYLPDGESYLAVRYARGLAREELLTLGDFDVTSADTVALEASLALGRAFELAARASVTRQGRGGPRDLLDASGAVSAGYRF